MHGKRGSKQSRPALHWVRTFEATSKCDREAGHTLYKVISTVYARGFPEAATRIVVNKRFSQIRKLHASLQEIHRQLHLPGQPPPALPRAHYLNRFEPHVVEGRRKALLDLLEFSAERPHLFGSKAFTEFFAEQDDHEQAPSDEEDMESGGERSMSPEEAAEVARLEASGQLLDASARTVYLDPTPALTPSTSARSSAAPTPTPAEEMQDLPDYLATAAEDVSAAVRMELEDDLDGSVERYRKAIGVLLSSVQTDKCVKRRASVKRRIAQYIQKAENLVEERDRRRRGGAHSRPASSLAAAPNADLRGSAPDLARYKVLDVISNKVLMVKDSKTGSKVVLKALQKSPARSSGKRSILPVGVPNMIKLLRYFETEDTLFLVLEYMPFGELYEILANVFEEEDFESSSPVNEDEEGGNRRVSVIKTSPSFAEMRSKALASSDGEGSSVGSVEIVQKVTDEEGNTDGLLCLARDRIESVEFSPNGEEEEDVFDFMEEIADEEGEEVLADEEEASKRRVSAARSLLTSIDSKLADEQDSSRAADLLNQLDSLESRLQSTLADGASPYRRPSSARPPLPPADGGTPARLRADPLSPIRLLPPFKGYSFRRGERPSLAALRAWAANMVRALDRLHSAGVIVKDLNPRNLLLGPDGGVILTYQCEWASVDRPLDPFAVDCLYAAPETLGVSALTPACDWWSLGVILYELSTGTYLVEQYPSGLKAHIPLDTPSDFGPELAALVIALLRPSPSARLGAGSSGANDIRAHPFFADFAWD